MAFITGELVRAVRTATPCRRNASARRAENVLSSYRFCRIAVRAVPRVFVCVACPGRSGRPARIPGIVTLGTVISQEFDDGIYPIAFHSQSLLPAEKNYDTHDKELAAVLFGFKCGRPLFLGAVQPIEVQTDHKNLQYFHQPQKITG
jgi:RNase H-like domain found in reverse transcriptase